MREVSIYIEINGIQRLAGAIRGESFKDATFAYDESFMEIEGIRPISVSLPFQKEPFGADETKCFFEGLLPEGFSRRAVANWVKADENDYLTILEKLGQECLGAIQVKAKGEEDSKDGYELLSTNQVKSLAAEGATKSTELLMNTHLSLTGASGKVGLYYDSDKQRWYLPIGSAASTHIVKQSHIRLNKIVMNEQLCILTAKNIGIEVPDSFIINLGNGQEQDVLYATQRYDRKLSAEWMVDGLCKPYRLHQEDFSQALGITASDKYEKRRDTYFMKRMFELLRKYSSNPIEDQLKMWDITVFNFLIGNTDCHVKNYSLIYSENMKYIRLAPAYDIVCTQIYGTSREMSFYIGGELNIESMSRDTFSKAAKEVGIGEKIAMKHFDNLVSKFEGAVIEAAKELQELGFGDASELRDKVIELFKSRNVT